MQSRRDFLALGATGAIALGAPLPILWQRAMAEGKAGPDQPVLVVLELNGGNDGLNTVIPFTDDIYHRSRPTLRVEPAKVLKLDSQLGLHPAMTAFRRLWDQGLLKVVQNVGYPNPNRSHFRSMQIWQAGAVGPAPTAGWLGRASDAQPQFGSCFVGEDAVPFALQARRTVPSALASLSDYKPVANLAGVSVGDSNGDLLLKQIEERFQSTMKLAQRLDQAAVSIPPAAPGTLADRLRTIRVLLEKAPEHRLFYTSLGGFDTHIGQSFAHSDLLKTVADSTEKFLKDLRDSQLDERVVVLVYSEFGRRLQENGSGGTDHGTSAPLFLAGKRIEGGILGTPPNLADLELGDPKFKIDYRDVYATLLRRWLKIDPTPILGSRDDSLPLCTKA